MTTLRKRGHCGGFSLIEVMVALIIISIGLLGIAKIQALAYASTGTASMRSLAALETASLASAMRANRNYWSQTPVALTVTFKTGAITATTDGTLNGGGSCQLGAGGFAGACTAGALAAYDLQSWIAAVNNLLPNSTGTLTCSEVGGLPPIGCTIQLSWSERTIALQGAIATGAAAPVNAAVSLPTYTLYVEP
jgi:type IV pilus assembly protein PilV